MASRLHHLRRTAYAAGALLLAAGGCAFPHGSTGGDPLLGNFHRPIVPTPPPERGGLGLDSPAYDAGTRIGVTAPEVPAQREDSSGFMTLPTLTNPNLLSGAKLPFQPGDDSTYTRRPLPGLDSGAGAKLPPLDPAARGPVVPGGYAPRTPDGVMARPRDPVSGLMSGSALAPAAEPAPLPPLQRVGHVVPRDPARIETPDEAREALRMAGAQGQRTEQLNGGEWLFACTAGSKVYEARGADPLDAMRKVLVQVQK